MVIGRMARHLLLGPARPKQGPLFCCKCLPLDLLDLLIFLVPLDLLDLLDLIVTLYGVATLLLQLQDLFLQVPLGPQVLLVLLLLKYRWDHQDQRDHQTQRLFLGSRVQQAR